MSEMPDNFYQNAYDHWKKENCLCKNCSLFRLILKSYLDYNFMVGFKLGFPEYWNIFKEEELNNE